MRKRLHLSRNVFVLSFGLLVAVGAHAQNPTPEEAHRFFEAKIRPVLAEQCYQCHGEKKQRADLRVDGRSHLLRGGDSGAALVLGDPEKSLIIKAIRQTSDDLKMPPKGKLTREQIEDFTRWVKMGAPWPGDTKEPGPGRKPGEKEITEADRKHWAFVPVRKPQPPAVKNAAWVRNPIDAFILSKLEAKGLTPSAPADKRVLVRRAYYNLTGLPPTPAEVEAFVKDADPQAYEKLIDRLLDSPRYGEKWARHWLDLVRYAETNSYERDNPKPNAWRYRDYVIRAMNNDVPFDRFLKEQLAGDEMPGAGPDQHIATGYYRLGIWDDEPSDPLQARYDGLDDIVLTTSQVFLGLTLDCARCHEHKIDPIRQHDYYRFLAFFHNINHYRNGGPTDEMPILRGDQTKAELDEKLKEIARKRDEVQARVTAIEDEFRAAQKKKGLSLPEKSDIVDLTYRFYRGGWKMLPDFANMKAEDTGKLPLGWFDLAPRTRNDTYGFVYEGTLLVPKTGRYTFHLDSDDGTRLWVGGNAIIEYDGIHGVGQQKEFALDLTKGATPIKLEYFQNTGGYGLYVAWSGPEFQRRLLSVPPDTKNASGDFNAAFKNQGASVLSPKRLKEYEKLKKDLEVLKDPAKALALEKALIVTEPGAKAPETFVLFRGNPTQKRDRVEPGFPTVLGFKDPPLAAAEPGQKSSRRRTQLADWLASPDNPLTARVFVNRLWQHQFGRGIVRSPNNFGFQGDRPTHPELLDWLAATFIERGWSMKEFHRLVMTSNAFRMSSHGDPAALKADPANDLFWRFDVRRLSAEEIRDSILAVAGNLNLKMFGPGVYPEIPKEVLAGQSVPGRGWPTSSPEEQARRSIYVHVKRSLLLPILDAFDLAETDRPAPVRFTSTVSTQALLMLNSDFIGKQADRFARRLEKEAGDDITAQVRLGLNLATSRPPTDMEVARAVKLIDDLEKKSGATRQAALKYFCLMALNLNEFMYVD